MIPTDKPEISISIHAPRVGSDSCRPGVYVQWVSFQSTLPVWGATQLFEVFPPSSQYFNPRSPCGERPARCAALPRWNVFQSTLPVWGATAAIYAAGVDTGNFNPRSPCGERPFTDNWLFLLALFQSTLPVWGATRWSDGRNGEMPISIHAPRVGSDIRDLANIEFLVYFNPRSPCGERLPLPF